AQDAQPRADSAVLPRVGAIALHETREDALEVARLELAAGIRDAQLDRTLRDPGRDRDARAARAELRGVLEQVQHDLLDAVGIEPCVRQRRVERALELETRVVEPRLQDLQTLLDHRAERHALALQSDSARFQVRQVEQAVDQLGHTRRLALDEREEL